MIHVIKNWLLSCKTYGIVIIITSVVVSSVEALIPYLTARFIDNVLIPKNEQNVYEYSAALLLLIGIFLAAKYILEVNFTKMQVRLTADSLHRILQKIAGFQLGYFQDMKAGYFADRLYNDLYDLISFALSNVSGLFMGVYMLLLATVYIAQISPLWFIPFAGFLLLYAVIYAVLKDKLFVLAREEKEIENTWFNGIVEMMENIESIKAHVVEVVYLDDIWNHMTKWKSINVFITKISFLFSNSRNIIDKLFLLILFIVGGNDVMQGELSVGDFTALNAYFIMAISSVSIYFNMAKDYQRANASYSRIMELLDGEKDANGERVICEPIKNILVRNLTCSMGGMTLFDSFSYDFHVGKIYCIFGKNGAGKSTFLKLLVGILQPTKGTIFYNGTPLEELDVRQLRQSRISILEQKPFIDSIIYKDKRMHGDIMQMYPGKFIEHMENDNTSVLSGGEKQKLFQSMFLRDLKGLMVLDEPTTALDVRSIEILWNFLREASEHNIVIVVSHDEMIASRADEIIRF